MFSANQDKELQFYSNFIETFSTNLNLKEQKNALLWLEKLRTPQIDDNIAREYLKTLVFLLYQRHLLGIFTKPPTSGHLKPLPSIYKFPYIIKYSDNLIVLKHGDNKNKVCSSSHVQQCSKLQSELATNTISSKQKKKKLHQTKSTGSDKIITKKDSTFAIVKKLIGPGFKYHRYGKKNKLITDIDPCKTSSEDDCSQYIDSKGFDMETRMVNCADYDLKKRFYNIIRKDINPKKTHSSLIKPKMQLTKSETLFIQQLNKKIPTKKHTTLSKPLKNKKEMDKIIHLIDKQQNTTTNNKKHVKFYEKYGDMSGKTSSADGTSSIIDTVPYDTLSSKISTEEQVLDSNIENLMEDKKERMKSSFGIRKSGGGKINSEIAGSSGLEKVPDGLKHGRKIKLNRKDTHTTFKCGRSYEKHRYTKKTCRKKSSGSSRKFSTNGTYKCMKTNKGKIDPVIREVLESIKLLGLDSDDYFSSKKKNKYKKDTKSKMKTKKEDSESLEDDNNSKNLTQQIFKKLNNMGSIDYVRTFVSTDSESNINIQVRKIEVKKTHKNSHSISKFSQTPKNNNKISSSHKMNKENNIDSQESNISKQTTTDDDISHSTSNNNRSPCVEQSQQMLQSSSESPRSSGSSGPNDQRKPKKIFFHTKTCRTTKLCFQDKQTNTSNVFISDDNYSLRSLKTPLESEVTSMICPMKKDPLVAISSQTSKSRLNISKTESNLFSFHNQNIKPEHTHIESTSIEPSTSPSLCNETRKPVKEIPVEPVGVYTPYGCLKRRNVVGRINKFSDYPEYFYEEVPNLQYFYEYGDYNLYENYLLEEEPPAYFSHPFKSVPPTTSQIDVPTRSLIYINQREAQQWMNPNYVPLEEYPKDKLKHDYNSGDLIEDGYSVWNYRRDAGYDRYEERRCDDPYCNLGSVGIHRQRRYLDGGNKKVRLTNAELLDKCKVYYPENEIFHEGWDQCDGFVDLPESSHDRCSKCGDELTKERQYVSYDDFSNKNCEYQPKQNVIYSDKVGIKRVIRNLRDSCRNEDYTNKNQISGDTKCVLEKVESRLASFACSCFKSAGNYVKDQLVDVVACRDSVSKHGCCIEETSPRRRYGVSGKRDTLDDYCTGRMSQGKDHCRFYLDKGVDNCYNIDLMTSKSIDNEPKTITIGIQHSPSFVSCLCEEELGKEDSCDIFKKRRSNIQKMCKPPENINMKCPNINVHIPDNRTSIGSCSIASLAVSSCDYLPKMSSTTKCYPKNRQSHVDDIVKSMSKYYPCDPEYKSFQTNSTTYPKSAKIIPKSRLTPKCSTPSKRIKSTPRKSKVSDQIFEIFKSNANKCQPYNKSHSTFCMDTNSMVNDVSIPSGSSMDWECMDTCFDSTTRNREEKLKNCQIKKSDSYINEVPPECKVSNTSIYTRSISDISDPYNGKSNKPCSSLPAECRLSEINKIHIVQPKKNMCDTVIVEDCSLSSISTNSMDGGEISSRFMNRYDNINKSKPVVGSKCLMPDMYSKSRLKRRPTVKQVIDVLEFLKQKLRD